MVYFNKSHYGPKDPTHTHTHTLVDKSTVKWNSIHRHIQYLYEERKKESNWQQPHSSEYLCQISYNSATTSNYSRQTAHSKEI